MDYCIFEAAVFSRTVYIACYHNHETRVMRFISIAVTAEAEFDVRYDHPRSCMLTNHDHDSHELSRLVELCAFTKEQQAYVWVQVNAWCLTTSRAMGGKPKLVIHLRLRT